MYKCTDCNKEFINKAGLSSHTRNGCSTKHKNKKFTWNCPICECEILYNTKNGLKYAKNNNVLCTECRQDTYITSSETREKISNTLKKKYESGEIKPNMEGAHREESRKKQSKTKTGRNLSTSHKENIKNSISNSDKFKKSIKCEKRGKKISNALKGRKFSEEHKVNLSINHADVSGSGNPFYGKSHTEETRRRLRKNSIDRINNARENGFQLTPFYNKRACVYFDKLMVENNIHIQHAENGGEFYIEELCYWVDGYDEENNIVYEWDEKQHFKSNGEYIEKDIIRQKEIEKKLGCKFIRIKQSDFIKDLL